MSVTLVVNGRPEIRERYKYGCFDHPPLKMTQKVQDGWTEDGRRIMVEIPFLNTTHCVYGQDTQDAACENCKWRTV